MKLKPGVVFGLSLLLPAVVVAETIYQSDSAGNVNQINIGVGKSNIYNGEETGPLGDLVDAERTFELQRFSKLRVSIPVTLVYVQGSGNRLTLRGPDKVLDKIEIKQQGSTLSLESKGGFHVNKGIEIEVSSGAGLELLELSGAVDVELKRVRTGSLRIVADGSVDLVAQGRADNCSIVVSGSGDIDLEELQCGTADVKLEGAADLSVYASNRIAGSLAGASDVTVFGNPKQRKLVVLGAVDLSYD